ncbi:hypothetical protein TMatcc_009428, partial [Talaromyces marneffei ATCC 18224]
MKLFPHKTHITKLPSFPVWCIEMFSDPQRGNVHMPYQDINGISSDQYRYLPDPYLKQ